MMKYPFLKYAFIGLSAITLFASCEKDNEGEGNEEEVITTMALTFTPQGGGAPLTFTYNDPDGPGGTAPTKDEIMLAPNRTYTVTVALFDRTKTPEVNMTNEVAEESNAHRFYYQPAAGSNITVTNLNNDTNGMPFGLTSTWTTGAAMHGSVKVTLRHYPGNPPNKAADDPVNSNKSSTDAEVDFSTHVQ